MITVDTGEHLSGGEARCLIPSHSSPALCARPPLVGCGWWSQSASSRRGVRRWPIVSVPKGGPAGLAGTPRGRNRLRAAETADGAGSLDQRSEEWPLCEGKSGALDASVRPSEGERELRGPLGRLSSALPRGGGEQGGGGIGAVGRGLGFHVAKTCLSGRGLGSSAHHRSESCLTSSPPPSRQRVGSERRSRAPI